MLKPNFKIFQGRFQDLGTPDQIAEAWKGYEVVCLTHGRTVTQSNGCLDARYDGMTQLIRGLRARNPYQLIFGYVPATADAPLGSGCGYHIPYGVRSWEAPNGKADRFIEWCRLWVDEGVDGIFIDLFSPHFISPLMRDNTLSYVRFLKLLAMVNITYPTAANVTWALASPLLVRGDYILLEGLLLADGVDTEAISVNAMAALRTRPDLHAAPLVTTEGHKPLLDSQRRNLLHRVRTFLLPGDALAIDPSNLGSL